MDQLSYRTLENMNYSGFLLKDGKNKVLQFGEGNFLRAFADDFIDIANERADFQAKVTIVQPIAQGLTELINRRDGLYTRFLRGSDRGRTMDEKRLISAVKKCINPYTDWQEVLAAAKDPDLEYFPAKLTRVLYERFTEGLRSFRSGCRFRARDSRYRSFRTSHPIR